MISSNQILSKLSPFKNYRKIVTNDQTVGDIINGILDTHEKYKSEYDKISEDFIGTSELETAKNIWNFLHSNVPYYIESTKNQTLRSPSAIVAMPGDCKSYALFSNGIFDSLNKKGIFKTPIAYRFADYRGINEFQHVFSVLYPGTNNEIWIDPVLPRFNEKKQPTSYKDKKIKMALIAMSGINSNNKETRSIELKNFLNKLVGERDTLLNNGTITPGSSKELEYKVAINKVTKAMQMESINGFGNISDQIKTFSLNKINGSTSSTDYLNIITAGGAAAAKGGLDPAADFAALAAQFKFITNLFGNKPNPDDWKGWEAQDISYGEKSGFSAASWTMKDGDSVQNEALNIMSWIKNYGINTILQFHKGLNLTPTIKDIVNKLNRAGYTQEAQQFQNQYSSIFSTTPNTPGSTQAGMNMYVTLGLVGAAIFLLTKMKK